MDTPSPRKVLVAVHGIGDQVKYETAQSVAFVTFDCYGLPPALPLGRFYQVANDGAAIVLMDDVSTGSNLAFAEVYWADVPRELVEQKYTLEEAKKWARTLVARLNLRAMQEGRGHELERREYRMLEAVLDELIDAVFVLENLTFLAGKAGLFSFDLKKVLNDFINDVQVVTEFERYRDRILTSFDAVMRDIVKRFPDAEIHIVGHSEGSVVSFLGLMHALSQEGRRDWAANVRGFMTIGSPIEIHVVLWRELMAALHPRKDDLPKIAWRNYFDSGDPIAYHLAETWKWLTRRGFNRFFDFEEAHDVEFGRYPLPGKAHVDYWGDKELFAHFLHTVVKPARPVTVAVPPPGQPPVPTKRFMSALSYVVPYALCILLMALGVFALYRPLASAAWPGVAEWVHPTSIAGDVSAFTLLLVGMTMMVRLPRLTGIRAWWAFAAILCGTSLSAFPFLISTRTGDMLNLLPHLPVFSGGVLGNVMLGTAAATALASFWSYRFPARGVKPLLVCGGFSVAAMVAQLMVGVRGAIWPVLIGGGFFLYLWWLATLLFDLSFVWHMYVRFGAAIKTMRLMAGEPPVRG